MFGIPLEWKLIAGALLVAALGGWHLFEVHQASVKATSACQASYAGAALKAEADNRAEEQRRAGAAQENALEAQRLATRARTDAARADAAAVRLRDAVAARLSAAASGPPAGVGVKATAGPDLVLPDVLGRAEQRLRDLAEIADARGVAGSACERAYDSLNSH